MTIVVYSDLIVPTGLVQAGAVGKLTRQNTRTVNQGGYASVNAIRDFTLRQYTLGTIAMSQDNWAAITALYEITDSGAFGMLLKDPTDWNITAAQGALIGYMAGVENGVFGFGNGTPLYGLRKLYTAAGSTRQKARTITRPNGNPAVLRNGAAVTVGAGAGNVAFSAGPVFATFVADSSANVSSVTPGATTQVVLASALSGLVITTGKLWLQGLAGADAALLNNLAHTITAISGSTYTLATNTAGKTITAAGQGQKYPQPTDTLTFSCPFYVPVQFADDAMDWELAKPGTDANKLISGPPIPLVEIRE